MKITERENGKIKELHGVNCAPYSVSMKGDQKNVDLLFGHAGIPRSRLHDCCGTWGGKYFVDIPNIFRDANADENDPESYDFHYTDEYIAAIIKTGANVVYRLGVTIEWGSKKYVSYPPEDAEKWATICEHIIRHYNEGWKEGFHYGIEYWEIWNEPENPPMWQGTKEQFFDLYRTASIHLKKRFPELKIGGYGSSGFYAVFRDEKRPLFLSFPVWFEEFLQMVKENGCPLDFFSWHIYTSDLTEIARSDEYVRKTLDRYGFEATESHLNEWNYGAEGKNFLDKETMVGASFCAAAFEVMQNGTVDLAQYYVASRMSTYNGFINLRSCELTPVAHVFAAFNRLFRGGNALVTERTEGEPHVLAARTGTGNGKNILISNYGNGEGTCRVELPQTEAYTVYEICDDGFVKTDSGSASVISLPCGKTSVYCVLTGDGQIAF